MAREEDELAVRMTRECVNATVGSGGGGGDGGSDR